MVCRLIVDDDTKTRGVQHSASAAAVPGASADRGGKYFRSPQATEEIGLPFVSPVPLKRSGGSQPTSAFHSTRNDWYDSGSGDYAEIKRE
uniref:Uncharacterized protein n=1 Tax=Panagrolaimus sp. JU765 TaxID=591449 RepID=A0AC34PYR6_9BILA